MSATERVWRLLEVEGKMTAEGFDLLTFELQADNKVYTVTVGGAKGMSITEITEAMRAACTYALRAGKVSPEAIARMIPALLSL
jgi:hypothetical protein